MPIPIFDSRDLRCKSPFGAVKEWETVSFTLFPPPGTLGAELLVFPADQWDSPAHPFQPGPFRGAPAYGGSFVPQGPPSSFTGLSCPPRTAPSACCPMGKTRGFSPKRVALWQLTVYDGAMSTPAPCKGCCTRFSPTAFAAAGRLRRMSPQTGNSMGTGWNSPSTCLTQMGNTATTTTTAGI